jgi:hypothetical protein
LDVLDPLVPFSQQFEDFFSKFFTIEVSASSRELEAFFDRGHGLVSLCQFYVIQISCLDKCYALNTLGQVLEAFEDFYKCFFQIEAQGSLWPHVEEVMPG